MFIPAVSDYVDVSWTGAGA